MKERVLYRGVPIVGRMPLFRADMRQVVHDDRKTQTRRIIKTPTDNDVSGFTCDKDDNWWVSNRDGMRFIGKCPYGKDGDVRCMCEPLKRGRDGLTYYRDDRELVISIITGNRVPWRWRRDYLAAIHMPTEAARTVRQITGVRVERAQEICPSDCEGEGITGTTLSSPVRGQPYSEYYNGDGLVYSTPRTAFAALWDSINKIRGYGWGTNPWVWVIEFEKMER